MNVKAKNTLMRGLGPDECNRVLYHYLTNFGYFGQCLWGHKSSEKLQRCYMVYWVWNITDKGGWDSIKDNYSSHHLSERSLLLGKNLTIEEQADKVLRIIPKSNLDAKVTAIR